MNKQKHLEKLEKYVHLGKADLHIHSNYSDAKPGILEILNYVENNTDLDIIAITDHDTIDGALEAQRLMEDNKYRFELIVGEEVSTKEGHIVGLFLKENIKPGMSVRKTLEEIHNQGGISIAVHPFQHTRFKNPKIIVMDGMGLVNLVKEKDCIDAVEIVNATPTLSEENLSADFINGTLVRKAEIGSSDAHILDAIGMGYTIFEGKTSEELRRAIKYIQTRAMHKKWAIFALFKYLFFFIPKGIRLAVYTIFHGRTEKKHRVVKK